LALAPVRLTGDTPGVSSGPVQPETVNVWLAAALVAVVPLVLWLAASTVGLPFGPHAGSVETVGLPGTVAAILDVITLLAAVLLLCHGPVVRWLADWHGPRDLAALAIVGAIGAVAYGGVVLILFGRDWLTAIRVKPLR